VNRVQVGENVRRILAELPRGVRLEAACKTRSPSEVQQAVDAGVEILGENYVREAAGKFHLIKGSFRRHFIGHLQRNKVKKALGLFDLIESLDSISLAEEISKRSASLSITAECLIEVNSAREKNKSGIYPEETLDFARKVSGFGNILVRGLMTMGPLTEDPEELRPYFRQTRELFEKLKQMRIRGCRMEILSMGMSSSYRTAVSEGANLVRVGTAIFGPREN